MYCRYSVTDMGFGSIRHNTPDYINTVYSLHEPWRASPESWHLSRIFNTITIISHTITSGEHLLRVGT